MKYLNDWRSVREDTSYQKAVICFLYAGVFIGHYLCEFYCKTIHCTARNIQRLFSKTICGGRCRCPGIHTLSGQDSYPAIFVDFWAVIYKASESFGIRIPPVDGLFQRNIVVYGSAGDGNQGEYFVYCRGSAALFALHSCIYCSALVLLGLSDKQVESAKIRVHSIDDGDGNHAGGIRKPGIDEMVFRDT